MFGSPCACRSKEDRLAGPDAGGARFDGVNERHRTAVEIGAGHDECGRALGHAEELRARLVECGGFGALVHGAAAHARMLLEKRKDGARALRREVWDEVPCGVAHPELGAGRPSGPFVSMVSVMSGVRSAKPVRAAVSSSQIMRRMLRSVRPPASAGSEGTRLAVNSAPRPSPVTIVPRRGERLMSPRWTSSASAERTVCLLMP